MQPIGAAADGTGLGLYSSCGGHQFSFTAGGSLQHVGSKKCVNAKSEVSVPCSFEISREKGFLEQHRAFLL